MKTARLLDTQQTIAVLEPELGTPVAWAAWLADIRRTPRPGKKAPSLYGHQLAPYATEGKRKPMYLPAQVAAFIDAVKADDPGLKKVEPPLYEFEEAPLLPWRWRKAQRITPAIPAPLKAA